MSSGSISCSYYTGQLLRRHENSTGYGFCSHMRTVISMTRFAVTERSCVAPISVLSGVSHFRLVFLLYAFRVGKKSYPQGCALVEPGGPWRLTFAPWRLENLRFFIQIICWAPWILQVQSTGLPSIFLRTQPCIRYSLNKGQVSEMR